MRCRPFPSITNQLDLFEIMGAMITLEQTKQRLKRQRHSLLHDTHVWQYIVLYQLKCQHLVEHPPVWSVRVGCFELDCGAIQGSDN